MEILNAIGKKYSYLILVGLNNKPKGLTFTNIQYDIVRNPVTTQNTIETLEEKKLIEKDEKQYKITQKGKEILPLLESILLIDEKEYPKTKKQTVDEPKRPLN